MTMRWKSAVRCAAAMMVCFPAAMVVAQAASQNPTTGAARTAATTGSANTGATSAVKLKPPLAGIVSMGNIYFHRVDGGIPDNSLASIKARPGLFDGVVINITWAQLQPKPGVLDTGALDAALADVRAYNKMYPKKPLRVLLRMWPGPVAPKWAKNIGGPPVTILHRDMKITVGRYWLPEYRAAWRALQDQMGAKYDSDPLIASVSNTTGSSITDEPLLLAGDPEISIKNLLAAGFTDAQYKQTLLDSPDDYRAWKTTVIEQTYSPFREIDSGRPVLHEEETIELMHHWREKMGARGVISQHAVTGPPVERLKFMYDEMKKMGQPMEVQTEAPAKMQFDATVQYVVSFGSPMLELWQGAQLGGFETQSADDLARWSAELRANAKQ